MRLLIHAEVDKIVSQWRHRAVEMRKGLGADARAYADALNECADELEILNWKIERGEL